MHLRLPRECTFAQSGRPLPAGCAHRARGCLVALLGGGTWRRLLHYDYGYLLVSSLSSTTGAYGWYFGVLGYFIVLVPGIYTDGVIVSINAIRMPCNLFFYIGLDALRVICL